MIGIPDYHVKNVKKNFRIEKEIKESLRMEIKMCTEGYEIWKRRNKTD